MSGSKTMKNGNLRMFFVHALKSSSSWMKIDHNYWLFFLNNSQDTSTSADEKVEFIDTDVMSSANRDSMSIFVIAFISGVFIIGFWQRKAIQQALLKLLRPQTTAL